MATGADEAAAASFLVKWGLWLFGIAWAAATGLVTWLWNRMVKKHDEEIASIKGTLKKLETDVSQINQKLPEDYTPLDRFEDAEARTRENIIDLHRKIEGSEQRLGSKIDSHHQQIMGALLQRNRD